MKLPRFGRSKIPARPDEFRLGDYSAFIGPHSPWSMYQPSEIVGGNYGQNVEPEQVLTGIVAVFACVSLIADVVGSLPLKLYRKSDNGREELTAGSTDRGSRGVRHPGSLARILGELPNSEMTAQELWETLIGHLCLWGNCYAEIIRGPDGRPKELWPLRPDRMRVMRGKNAAGVPVGERQYWYTIGPPDSTGQRKEIQIPTEMVMHIHGLSTDGVKGLSPITVARTTYRGDQGRQQYAASWFNNSATPSVIVKIPKGPQEKFAERARVYRESMQQMYSGASNAGRIAVVEEGVDWGSVGMSFVDQQFVQQSEWSVMEWARLYRIPNHLVGINSKDTSWGTGIEQIFLSWLAIGLRPYLKRIEGGVNRDLGLIPGDKTLLSEGIYPEFVTNELTRTDIQTRYDAYLKGIQNGFLTPNDVRAWENLSPLPSGDDAWMPANYIFQENSPDPDEDTQPQLPLEAAPTTTGTDDTPTPAPAA